MTRRRSLRDRRTAGRFQARELARLKRALAGSPRNFAIAADRWSPTRVGRLIRTRFSRPWSNAHSVRALRQQGLVLPFIRAREARLSAWRRGELLRLLAGTPAQAHVPGERWSRKCIAQLLEQRFRIHYSPQHVGRIVRALGLRRLLRRHPRNRLSSAQARQLRRLLQRSPSACALTGTHWTRRQVSALIADRFGVQYLPRSVLRVLRRWHIGIPLAADPRREPLSAAQLQSLTELLTQTPRELGLEGNLWTQRRIARLLERRFGVHYRASNINRALKRWSVSPRQRPARGGLMRLNGRQVEQLTQALQGPPSESGLIGARWTRTLLCQLVLERFHARYAPSSMARWLRRLAPHACADQTSAPSTGRPHRSA